MNVRLDRSVKRAGDAVLEACGCTPSRIVCALWECLSVQGRVPDVLERMHGQEELDAGDRLAADDEHDVGARDRLGLREDGARELVHRSD